MNTQAKKADTCPNCSQSLQGEHFCPNCGQRNDVRRIRFRHFISESLSNFFAVDGRFIHTLVVLFAKPGLVPKDYIEGKRQRYVHPIRIYFLSSILLLFLIQYSGNNDSIVNFTENPETTDSAVVIAEQLSATDSLMQELAEEDKGSTSANFNIESPGRISRMMSHYSETGETEAMDALVDLGIEPSLFNRFLYAQSIKVADFDDIEFSRYFASKLFWVLFLFLPVLAGLLHLLYLRRNFYYPEHLFFTFYNQAAFFLVLSLGFALVQLTGIDAIMAIFIMAFLIYQYLALRRFYGQGGRKTLLKFFILNLITVPLFSIFFILAALITFIIF